MQEDTPLSLLALLLGELRGDGVRERDGSQCTGMDRLARGSHACMTEVYIAVFAVESSARENIHVAHVAVMYKLRSVWIVQVVEHHHGRVLCSAQLIELVVITLTEIQERLAGVEVLALLHVVDVYRIIVERRHAISAPNEALIGHLLPQFRNT